MTNLEGKEAAEVDEFFGALAKEKDYNDSTLYPSFQSLALFFAPCTTVAAPRRAVAGRCNLDEGGGGRGGYSAFMAEKPLWQTRLGCRTIAAKRFSQLMRQKWLAS